jgi:hypothetical protein
MRPFQKLLMTSCLILSTATSGCVGLLSNLMYAVKGEKVPAEFDGLKEKKVAVLAINADSPYQDDVSSRMLARQVTEILQTEVKKIEMLDEDVINQWRDKNGWENMDFQAMGKDIGADMVVVFEMSDLKLKDGATIFRGHCGVNTTVYDVALSKKVFRKSLEDFTYPTNAGQHTTETTEARFRRTFLVMLGQRLARYFYNYDFEDTFALDAKIASS